MKKRNKDYIILIYTIGVPLTSLLIAYVASELQGKIKFEFFVYSILLIAISIIFSLVYSYAIEGTKLERIDSSIGKLELSINRYASQNNAPTLYTLEQVVAYERQINAKEIWLISEDLSEELSDGPFADTVSSNLKKGTRYIYFAPNLPNIRARFETIKQHHSNYPIDIVYLPKSFFFLTETLDITIFNPLSPSNQRSGFLGLPLHNNDSDHYHIAIEGGFIDKIVGALLPSYKELSIKT